MFLDYVRFWFWVDLISSIPFTWFSEGFKNTNISGGTSRAPKLVKIMKISKILKILKLLRLMKLKKLMERFDDYCNKRGISNKFGAKEIMRENLFNEFAYDHGNMVPLDIIELERILARIRAEKSRRGPKKSTTGLKYLAFTLSKLKRLDAYLKQSRLQRECNLYLSWMSNHIPEIPRSKEAHERK